MFAHKKLIAPLFFKRIVGKYGLNQHFWFESYLIAKPI